MLPTDRPSQRECHERVVLNIYRLCMYTFLIWWKKAEFYFETVAAAAAGIQERIYKAITFIGIFVQ